MCAYIDEADAAANKALFDALLERRDAIGAAFGATLDWQRNDRQEGLRDRTRSTQRWLA